MKFSKENIDNLIEAGYLTKTKHPTKDLWVLKYSRNCQYENEWNDITLIARGLVIDANYNIIARPFGKFFNIEQHDIKELPIKDGFEVFEKMDGSLGIVFYYDGEWHVATSASFISDQAVKGKEMLETYGTRKLDPAFTYLFEIIYPDNRVVVEYGDVEDMVLLSAFNTETGRELSYSEIKSELNEVYNIVPRYDGLTDIIKLREVELDNKEGYVIRFSNGMRVKVKFAEYVRLHAILTEMSNLVVWRSLRYGYDLDFTNIPDEFDAWIKETKKDLLAEFGNEKYEINKRYFDVMRSFGLEKNYWFSKRKVNASEFAERAKKDKKYFDYTMMKFNGKDIDDSIWRKIRPTYTLPFYEEV